MPNATALQLTALEYTINNFPACSTIPVRSSIALGASVESYSINSALVGVLVSETASLIAKAVFDLLTIDTLHTAKVSAGTVYNVVYVPAAKSAGVPKIPDGIVIPLMIVSNS
jgi:hypothetical protein